MNKTESNKNSLSERQTKALPFFASCLTYEEACRRAEINRTTFYEWLKDPLFKNELNRLRDVIIHEAVGLLKTSATAAVEKLVHLMNTSSNENIQRMSANDVLDHLVKFKHIEIEQQVREIENKLKELGILK